MSRALVPVLRFAALVAFTLVLAHELVFLVRYGSIYGEALVHSGHGEAWSDAVLIVLSGGALLLGAALVGLGRLARQWRQARQLGGRSRRSLSGRDVSPIIEPVLRPVLGRWLRTAAWLSVAVLVLLTLQENLEHAAAGFGLPGPGILLSEDYPFAPQVVAAVALVVSLVATLVSWRRHVLIARIAAARRAWLGARVAGQLPDVPWVDHRHAAIVGHHIVGRAPPSPAAARHRASP